MNLTDIADQQNCTIEGFDLPNSAMLSRLYALGLVPGAQLQVIRRAPLGDPMQVRVRGSLLSIRNNDAAGILVKSC